MKINKQHSSLSTSVKRTRDSAARLKKLADKKVLKKPTSIQKTRATCQVDLSSQGDFLVWGREIASRALVQERIKKEGQTKLSDERKIARAVLKERVVFIAQDATHIVDATNFLSDYLRGAELSLEDELLKLLKSADKDTIPAILEMLMIRDLDCRFPYHIAKILEERENRKVLNACVNFLRYSDDAYLEILVSNIQPTGTSSADDLARSLLGIRDKDYLLEHLMEGLRELRENQTCRKFADEKENLIVSVMRQSTGIPGFNYVAELYKTSTDEDVVDATSKLLVNFHRDLAAPVFLEVTKDSKGITPLKARKIMGDWVDRAREKRYHALSNYVEIARRDAWLELRNILLNDKDATIVTRTIELLLTKRYFGDLGQKVIKDTIDDDIKNGRPSLTLACLAWACANKDYKDFEDPLLVAFSTLSGLANAFRNLDGVWLCNPKTKGEMAVGLFKRSTQEVVMSISLKRLIRWMTSENKILVENAIQVFKLAGDENVSKFIPSRCHEASLLREWLGTKRFGEKLHYEKLG